MVTLMACRIKTVSNLLRDIDELRQVYDLSPERHYQLSQASGACQKTLSRCNLLANKCPVGDPSLESRGGLRRAWHRLQADPDDVRKLRSHLNSCVSDLSAILTAMQRWAHVLLRTLRFTNPYLSVSVKL